MPRNGLPKSTKTATRRRLLLVSAVSAASVPDRWLRPVIESVLLPAHAQTTHAPEPADPIPPDPAPSCSLTPVSSTPSTVAAQTADEPPEDFDNADINFDGCDSLSLAVTDSDEGLGGPDADIVLSVDVDPWAGDDTSDEFLTFDITHLGGPRWSVLSDTFGGVEDLPSGTYSLQVERTGGGNEGRQFEISVTVTVTTVDSVHQRVELSAVSATPL